MVPFSDALNKKSLTSVKASQDLWHCQLSHPSSTIVQRVLQENNLRVIASNDNSTVCNACQQAKSHQLPFSLSNNVSSSPLELVFTDVWGPALTSKGGNKCYVCFVDDFSKFTWINCLKCKSDVAQVFIQFQKHVERLLDKTILCVQSD